MNRWRKRAGSAPIPRFSGLSSLSAFNAHLDLVRTLDAATLRRIDRILRGQASRRLRDAIRRGEPRELLLDGPTYRRLRAQAGPFRPQTGGQAGIVANLLSALGAKSHVVTALYAPELRGTLRRGVLLHGARAAPVKSNLVFEYGRGFRGAGGAAPGAGRVILAQPVRGYESRFPASFRWPARAGPLGLIFLGGFQNEPLRRLRSNLKIAASQLRRLRELRQAPLVHVELQNEQVRGQHAAVLGGLSGAVDSLGFDAVELEELAGTGGPAHPLQAQLDAMRGIRSRYRIPRIQLHTPLYVATVVPRDRDPVSVRSGMLAASHACDAAASTGRFATRQAHGTPGRLQRESLRAMRQWSPEAASEGIRDAGDTWEIVVPKTSVSRPCRTVGLGDVLSATSVAYEAHSRSE